MQHRVLLLALFAGLSASAQVVDGSVRGQITDRDDRAIPSAQVALTEAATGLERQRVSNREGAFVFASLPAGEYEVEVRADGFANQRGELQLNVGEALRTDWRLNVGSETVEVEVEGVSESPSSGAVITNNYITNLPLNGRNFMELALLVNGTTPAAAGSAGTARGRFAFQANGAREDSNSFIYDGVYAIDPVLNSFTFTPPVDAIREFRIETSNSEAGQGRNSGAQVSVVLKRGGNDLHGTAYEFLRNSSLDARNFFDLPDQPQPKLRQNQYGVSLGGPVRKNSTFFFGDYEGLRERRAITQTANVPTAMERQGDFSDSAFSAPINFFTGQPFENGRLPFAHPIGQGVANLYPLPNRSVPGSNFVSAPISSNDTDKFDFRLDQRLGKNGLLAGRYSFAERDFLEPFAAGNSSRVPGYGNDVYERGQNLMASESHTFSGGWMNEARFGYNRVGNRTFHQNSGTSINQTVGLPDFATRRRDLGLTFIEVTGLSPLGGEFTAPQDGAINSYQLSDTVSAALGDHFLQFGFEQRWIAGNAFRDVQARGQISFTNFAATQNALADLLLGLPSFTAGARSDNEQNQRTSATNFFVSDSWRLHPHLTLNLGLRYEFNKPAFDSLNAASVFDTSAQGFVPVGTGGAPRAGFNSDRNNFAPRVGLAWSPGGSTKTVIRTGYGVYYNFAALAPGQGIYFNPPFFNFLLFFPSRELPITIDNPWPEGANAPLPPSAFTYDRRLRSSYAQQWNFTIQQELSSELLMTVGYNGTRGTKLLGSRDINQPAPSPQEFNLRPLPFFSDINQIESSFDSVYHSLQFQLQCRFRAGLTGLFGYTWSRSIDNASNFFTSTGNANYPQDSRNIGLERGRSSFDIPHRFVGSWAYDLPFGEGKRWGSNASGAAGKILSGWKINSIVTFQSGQPYTVALPSELDRSNTGRSIAGFGAGDRPNVVGNPNLANPDPSLWFDPGAFALPEFGSFGNAGRNIINGPPLNNVNFSILKDTQLGETTTLQFRAEFFNFFNTSNFGAPGTFFGTPGFGQILSAHEPREVQFGVKLLF